MSEEPKDVPKAPDTKPAPEAAAPPPDGKGETTKPMHLGVSAQPAPEAGAKDEKKDEPKADDKEKEKHREEVTEPKGLPIVEPASPATPATTAPELPAATTPAPAASAEPPPGIAVELHGQTDVGLVREHNEDNFVVVDLSSGAKALGVGAEVGPLPDALAHHKIGERGTVFAVCDGMGGAAAGEVASRMAVDTVLEVMSSGPVPKDRDDFARRLVRAIEEAGSRIFTAAKLDRTRRGMGTTSTVAGLMDKTLFVGQVGDSRAYLLRGGDFKNITKDQSLVRQLIEAGQLTEEEADAFEHSNIILQALGTAEQVQVDLTFLELRRGDRLMLCSDGLSGLVHAEMIKDVMATVHDRKACCATLIEMARTGGGHDNITVIVVDFDGQDLAAPGDGVAVAYQQYPLPAATDRDPSLPPRDVGMKSGGPKPGKDVKGGRASASDDGGGMSLGMIAIVIAVLAVLGVIAMLAFGGGGNESRLPEHPEPQHIVDHSVGALPTYEVRVHADVPSGDVYVDDERQASLGPDGATLRLPTGVYTLVVKEGDAAVTDPLRVVVSESGASVMLRMPHGRLTVDEDGGAAIGLPLSPLPSDAGSDAGTVEAPPPMDAGPRWRRDAGERFLAPPRDAGPRIRRDAGAAQAPVVHRDGGPPHVTHTTPQNGIQPNPF